MQIDKATLESYIAELDFSDQARSTLLAELESDPKRAEKFVGQRLRQSDYSKKTQELADQRKTLEGTVSQQVREYATKLSDAEQKMNKVLKDLENEQISRTTAETRLQRLKVQYELSDEDIPKVDVPPSKREGADINIDDKLKAFKKELVDELMPELMSFPRISAIQGQIRDEHFELTGKRLSAKDMDELVKDAGTKGGLEKAWEEKYGIKDIRTKNYETGLEQKYREKWDAEQKAKASEQALNGVRGARDDNSPRLSPILSREFNQADDSGGKSDTGKSDGKSDTGNGKRSSANKSESPAHKMSGADRAATKWMERRNLGIPLGREAATK